MTLVKSLHSGNETKNKKNMLGSIFYCCIIIFIMSQLNPQRSQTGTDKTFVLETRRIFFKDDIDRRSTSFFFRGYIPLTGSMEIHFE
jgi:hypothetical protein